MTKHDEYERRVGVLEAKVAQLQEDYAATRTMAAMASQDVDDGRPAVNANAKLLNSIRQTQVEHGKTIKETAELVGSVVVAVDDLAKEHRFTHLKLDVFKDDYNDLRGKYGLLNEGQRKLRERIDGIAAGQDELRAQFTVFAEGQAAILAQLKAMAPPSPN